MKLQKISKLKVFFFSFISILLIVIVALVIMLNEANLEIDAYSKAIDDEITALYKDTTSTDDLTQLPQTGGTSLSLSFKNDRKIVVATKYVLKKNSLITYLATVNSGVYELSLIHI